ncbi:MAG TPA: M28 family metallopeptidase, partial [Bryobacterales bacterium]|nr:M28 family metallopeptidase [Bryobacterales bacterium]
FSLLEFTIMGRRCRRCLATGLVAVSLAWAAESDWQQRFRGLPQPDHIREYIRAMTEEPHHAGSPGSKKVAEYVLSKFREWGLEAQIEEFEALLPTPNDRTLELIEPQQFTARLKEPAIPEDKDSSDPGQLPTFNAYSPDGDVTGQVVYVNHGVVEDYERLARMGVDVKGKIVLARYGAGWRGVKPKLAWEHGAIGCLIYSDPREDGYFQGDVYPGGPFRPAEGVQRGSVIDMPIYPGDPLTPGWASERGGRKLPLAEARTLPKIPVFPISYADATPILRNMAGPVAPEPWRGALPLTYHVGPGPATVHLKLSFDWQTRPIYNVIARIPGSDFPDQWVIYGNHHDAWVNGARDPASGNAALLETARGLSELLKQGWKPRRTIILASWDAEEWGLIGSTEWGEKHAEELRQKAVVYINSDGNSRGLLQASGSHSLEHLLNEVARSVPDPQTGKPLWEAMRSRRLQEASDSEKKKAIASRSDLGIGALGAGSDYVVFIDHLGIPSLNIGFSSRGGEGVYHSIYDSFEWYCRFGDPTFIYGRALAQVAGSLLLSLADDAVLPFEFGNLADTLEMYTVELQKLKTENVDLSPLRPAIAALRKAAARFDAARKSMKALSPARLRELNVMIYQSEQAMLSSEGLPDRPWYRHEFYAPGVYTGYDAKTLPGIREAIEQKQWQRARTQVEIVKKTIDAVTRQILAAADLMR